MRAAIVNEAGPLALAHPRYVMRITGDSREGKAELDNFIDPESRFPVIATTSELMTTGIDARTCKLIVLDKTINSMTTFKQIIGRGTRILEEHNKFYFTIIDFKQATKLFSDPDFDGEPVVIYEPDDDDPPVPPDPNGAAEDDQEDEDEGGGESGEHKIYVSGVPVRILAERVEYVGTDGKLVTESYRAYSRKQIESEFASLDDFIRRWNAADRKQAILDECERHGVVLANLAAEVGKDLDLFDLILHIAYDRPPLTRKERAESALLSFINDKLFPGLKALEIAGPGGVRRAVVRGVFEDAFNYMKSGQLVRQVINKLNEIDFNDLSQRQHFGDIYEQILNDLQSAGNAGEYYTPRAVTAFMADRIDPRPGELLLDPACGTGGFLTCAIRHMREHYVKTPADEQAMQGALRAVEKKPLPHMLCVTNMLLHRMEAPEFVVHGNTLARPYADYRPVRSRRYRPDEPAFRRQGGIGDREQFSHAIPHPRNGRPVPCPHCATVKAGWPRRSGTSGRYAVRRGRQDQA
jgi:hypothetical protein